MDLTSIGGRWRGTWRTWVEPDQLYSEGRIEATTEPIFDGKAAILRYTAELEGHVDGYVLIGSTQEGAVVDWLDTWHTSGLVMSMHGEPAETRIVATTTYGAEDESWHWTTDIGMDDEGRLQIRHYNEGPDIPRYLGVEAVLERIGD